MIDVVSSENLIKYYSKESNISLWRMWYDNMWEKCIKDSNYWSK